MALLWMDGMDGYASASDLLAYYSAVSNDGISTTAGRFGGGCDVWSTDFGNQSTKRVLGSTETDLWVGVAFKFSSVASGNNAEVLGVLSGSGYEGLISFNGPSRTIRAYLGQGVVLLGESAGNDWSMDTWHWVELHYVFSDTVGVIEVWIDGVRKLNLTSQDTKSSSASGITIVSFGDGATFSRLQGYMDDRYVLNTSGAAPTGRLGDQRITSLVPNGDASPNNGTPSTGTDHFAVVDEIPANTSDYVTIVNTTGQEELFDMSALPNTPSSITAVAVSSYLQKSDAGTAAGHNKIKSGSSSQNGTSFGPTTTWGWSTKDIVPLDPATSAAWLVAAVNAIKAGYVVE